MKIAYIGLGKMGLNMATRLVEKGHDVLAYNRSEAPRVEAEKNGIKVCDSLASLVQHDTTPRIVWIMVTHTAVDAVLSELIPLLSKGDTVIDGGNSPYTETVGRAKELSKQGISFLDAGVSGGPSGARNGACVMVGGDKKVFDGLLDLFKDISAPDAFGYMGTNGAGHFVKMVHNGIEYGMMQAIAEGFAIMKASLFGVDLEEVARVYNNESVIESRLVGWLQSGFKEYGTELKEISGTIAHTGEGEWTVQAGKEYGVDAPIIQSAFDFRVQSKNNPSYTGKVVSVLRNQFGGHSIQGQEEKK
ncbi:MAG: decarboxylating 6-phosphogluconate dehydrogenase [Candidatus Paceibacterota bacterium]